MTLHNEKQQATVTGEKKPSRFQIEKLEERIAPAKGGITGPPDGAGYIGHCKGHKYGWSC